MKLALATVALACVASAAKVRRADDSGLLYSIRDDVLVLQKEAFNLNTARLLGSSSLALASSVKRTAGRVDGMILANAELTKNIQGLADEIDSLYKDTGKDITKIVEDNKVSLAEINKEYAAKVADSTKHAKALEVASLLTAKLKKQEADLAAAQAALKKKLLAKATKDIEDLGKTMDSKITTSKHYFSGGPRKTHQSGGWHDMEWDREEFNTAAPYFKVKSANRFQILKAGLFHFHFTWMAHCHHSHRHAQFSVGGKNINANYHQYDNHWHTNWYEVTWNVQANKEIRMRVYACNHAWHGSASINAHDRVRVSYEGEVSADKCQSSGDSNMCRGH